MSNVAIVVAAGQGTRFGASLPKQFLMLHDRPVIAHTLQRFEDAPLVEQVLVVASKEWLPYLSREIVERFHFKKIHRIVAGGARRQDSVWAGLQEVDTGRNGLVLVHDAVRPTFSPALLERVIAGCEGYDGCIPIMRPHDTVKSLAGSLIQATIDRETLGLAQTPQAFRNGVLKRAFMQAGKDHVVGTDEAALVERIGGRITWIEGEECNFKITTPRDLEIAELFGREIT